ncbi:AraC family transcriptional regulator [Paenibacillus sp. HB172176]|uniref:AraC family transcriptional regulator n=1 Tax=Paenibacillus sp. HB172176 TaxID=2493690 RepID=UPI00143C28B2|nr:AraC family transcriptional regulator [Paenibacillus sp. HB172176]
MYVLQHGIAMDRLQQRIFWARDMLKQPEFVFGPVTNPFTVCWLIVSGERTIETDDNELDLKRGHLLFFTPGTKYRLLPGRPNDSDFHYYSLGYSAVLDSVDLCDLFAFPRLSFHAGNPELQPLMLLWEQLLERFEQIAEDAKDRPHLPHFPHPLESAAFSCAYLSMKGLLTLWLSSVMGLLQPQLAEYPRQIDPRVADICRYIRESVHLSPDLDSLARKAHLSPGHLSHLFNQSLGMPPMEYLRRCRLQLAKELLLNTSLSLKDISLRIGFGEQSQFSRSFRAAEGISPLQYRRQWKSY